MKYYPKYKTPGELLIAVGFKLDGQTSYTKITSTAVEKRGERLHAYTHAGYIDMHYDRIGGPNGHRSKSMHDQVKKHMKIIVTHDKSNSRFRNAIDILVQKFNSKFK